MDAYPFITLQYTFFFYRIQNRTRSSNMEFVVFHRRKGIHLLFRKDDQGRTPFEIACPKFGYDKVMEFVEDTIMIGSSSSSSNNIPPLNIVDALTTANINENIHSDCVTRYFTKVTIKIVAIITTGIGIDLGCGRFF
ncbi:MAG: hypothetical protein ACI8RD_014588 [Bacillariaceae sp.]|jgi:hypothetical protein